MELSSRAGENDTRGAPQECFWAESPINTWQSTLAVMNLYIQNTFAFVEMYEDEHPDSRTFYSDC